MHAHTQTHAHVHTDGLDDKICFLSYNIHQKVQWKVANTPNALYANTELTQGTIYNFLDGIAAIPVMQLLYVCKCSLKLHLAGHWIYVNIFCSKGDKFIP